MKLISWGFIGCGEVTEKKSGPAFDEVEGSHVEAVMSRSEAKARSYAERHHIRNGILMHRNLLMTLMSMPFILRHLRQAMPRLLSWQ